MNRLQEAELAFEQECKLKLATEEEEIDELEEDIDEEVDESVDESVMYTALYNPI